MKDRCSMADTSEAARSDALSARPTSCGLAGKCTARVSTLVPEAFALELQRFAFERGYPSVSDCVREILLIAVHGGEAIENLHRDRIKRVAEKMTGIGAATDGGAS